MSRLPNTSLARAEVRRPWSGAGNSGPGVTLDTCSGMGGCMSARRVAGDSMPCGTRTSRGATCRPVQTLGCASHHLSGRTPGHGPGQEGGNSQSLGAGKRVVLQPAAALHALHGVGARDGTKWPSAGLGSLLVKCKVVHNAPDP